MSENPHRLKRGAGFLLRAGPAFLYTMTATEWNQFPK